MSPQQQVSFFKFYRLSLYAGLLLLLFSSCVTVPRKYPKNKPFIYKTNISISGNMKPFDKQDLISKLQNQLDDSLKTRVVSYAGVYKEIIKPPAFDTANVVRSKKYMTALLNSLGYFYATVSDTFLIDTNKNKQKVTVNFQVTTGKQTRLDSLGFDLLTPELQQLSMDNKSKTLLKKGNPYSLQIIAEERERLLQIFHNNGFYKVSGDDIYAEVDTVVAALIDPSLDPFEQVRLLDSLRRKSNNPTINVVFKQREAYDTTHLKRFHIGTVHVYPDQDYLQDSIVSIPDTTLPQNYKFKFFNTTGRFSLPFIARNIYIIPDSLYIEKNYFRTVNTFNRLGAWQSVEVNLKERYDSIPMLDAEIRLYPATKYGLKIDLEFSRNIADYIAVSQLFGIGLNFSLSDRNAYKQSIQTTTNARFGIEFGSSFIQTVQSGLSHTIFFPRIISPFHFKNLNNLTNPRTIINANGSYTVRREIYDVKSINTSLGYEWTTQIHKQPFTWLLTFPNIEYTLLNAKDSLYTLEKEIPSLRYAFNDGFVIGIIGGVNTGWNKRNHFSNLRLKVEESGAVFGFIKNLEENNLFRFVKTDIEYKHFINNKRSAWAFRTFGGFGYVYGRKGDQPEYKLPFFKAYYAGGPYSMRAWRVRQLGPGSTTLYDTTSSGATDRFGNMQLEGNVEFRFNLTTIAGIKIKSALFIDMGNIWGVEFSDSAATVKIPEATFKLSRLGQDIAIGGGASLRFDFDFFLIRLDWAYKLKDPRYSDINKGWFYDLRLFNGQFQLGIGYPF